MTCGTHFLSIAFLVIATLVMSAHGDVKFGIKLSNYEAGATSTMYITLKQTSDYLLPGGTFDLTLPGFDLSSATAAGSVVISDLGSNEWEFATLPLSANMTIQVDDVTNPSAVGWAPAYSVTTFDDTAFSLVSLPPEDNWAYIHESGIAEFAASVKSITTNETSAHADITFSLTVPNTIVSSIGASNAFAIYLPGGFDNRGMAPTASSTTLTGNLGAETAGLSTIRIARSLGAAVSTPVVVDLTIPNILLPKNAAEQGNFTIMFGNTTAVKAVANVQGFSTELTKLTKCEIDTLTPVQGTATKLKIRFQGASKASGVPFDVDFAYIRVALTGYTGTTSVDNENVPNGGSATLFADKVHYTRAGGDPFGGDVDIVIDGFTNPSSNYGGPFTLTMYDANDVATGTCSPAVSPLAQAALTAPDLDFSEKLAGAVTTATFEFGIASAWAVNDKLTLFFPPAFSPSGISTVGLSCPGPATALTSAVHAPGQITWTRTGSASIGGGTCTLTVPGMTLPDNTEDIYFEPFQVLTLSADGNTFINVGSFFPPEEIAAAYITDLNVTVRDPTVYALTTMDFAFTLAGDLDTLYEYIEITIDNKAYDAQAADTEDTVDNEGISAGSPYVTVLIHPTETKMEITFASPAGTISAGTVVKFGVPNMRMPLGTNFQDNLIQVSVRRAGTYYFPPLIFDTTEQSSLPLAAGPQLQPLSLTVDARLDNYVAGSTGVKLSLHVSPSPHGGFPIGGLTSVTVPSSFSGSSIRMAWDFQVAPPQTTSGFPVINATAPTSVVKTETAYVIDVIDIDLPSVPTVTEDFYIRIEDPDSGLSATGVAHGVQLDRGSLGTASVTSNNTLAGQLGSFKFNFITETPVPAPTEGEGNGFIIEFPEDWDISEAYAPTDLNENMSGGSDAANLTLVIDNQSKILYVNRTVGAGTLPGGTNVEFIVHGIRSQFYAGSAKVTVFSYNGDEFYDSVRDAATQTFTAPEVGDAVFSMPDPEATSDIIVYVSFTAVNPIPADASFFFDVPTGYDVSSLLCEIRVPFIESTTVTPLSGTTVLGTRDGKGPVIERGTQVQIRFRNLATPAVGAPPDDVTFSVYSVPLGASIMDAAPGLQTKTLVETPANELHGPLSGTVKKQSVRHKTLTLASATISFAEWKIEMEDEIYLNGQLLNSFTKTSQESDGSALPDLARNAGGAAELWCDWGTAQTSIWVNINSWPPPPPVGAGPGPGAGGSNGPPTVGGSHTGAASSGQTKYPPPYTLLVSPPYLEPIVGMLPAFGGVPLATDTTDPKRLNLIVVTSVAEEGKKPVHFYSEEQMEKCKVMVPGSREGAKYTFDLTAVDPGTTAPNRLTDDEGVPLNFEVTFPSGYTERDCDYDQFEQHQTRMQKALDTITTSTRYEQANAARVLLAALRVGDAYLDCKQMIGNYIGAAQTQTVTLTGARGCFIPDTSSTEWAENPCCNKTLGFYQCCGPQNVDIEYTSVGSINEERLAFECAHPDAIAGLLNDYNTGLQQIEHPLTGCSAVRRKDAPDSLWDSLRTFYGKCEGEIFGTDGTGIECTSDNDCYTTCQGQGTKRCAVPWDNAGKYLVACFKQNMPELLRRFFLDQWDLGGDADDDEFQSEFDRRLSEEDCVGPSAWQFKSYVTFDYDDQGNYVEEVVEADITQCLSSVECNWQPGLEESVCTHPSLSPQYCAQCYGDFCFTRDDITDQETCETGECLFGGTVCDPDNGFCDAYCGDNFEFCTTAASCATAGICNDYDLYSYNQDNGQFQQAACVIPWEPTDDGGTKSCTVVASDHGLNTFDVFETALGCVDYTKYTQATCEAAGFGWHLKANSEANCTAHGFGCFDKRTQSFNGKSEEDCNDCSQDWRARYSWQGGQWFGDTREPFQWRNRTYGPVNRVSSTINRGKLEKEVDRAVSAILGSYYNIEARCTNKLLNIEQVVVADCSSGAADRPDATQTIIDLDLGSATLFSSFGQEYQQSTGKFKLADDTDTSGAKTQVNLKQVSIGQFAGQGDGYIAPQNQRRRARMQILRRPSLNRNAYDVVRDSGGNVVGQLTGDGMALTLSSASSALEVCLEQRADIDIDPQYQTIGYAGADARGSVGVPLTDLAVSLISTAQCAQITSSGTYFPIAYNPALVGATTDTSTNTSTGTSTGTTSGTSSDPWSNPFNITLLVSVEAFNETWHETLAAALGIPSSSVRMSYQVIELPANTDRRILEVDTMASAQAEEMSLGTMAQQPEKRTVYKLEGVFAGRRDTHYIEPRARIHDQDTRVRILESAAANGTHAYSVTLSIIDTTNGLSASSVATIIVTYASNGYAPLGILKSTAVISTPLPTPVDVPGVSTGYGNVIFPADYALIKPSSAARVAVLPVTVLMALVLFSLVVTGWA